MLRAIFDTHGMDTSLNLRSGQMVAILRALTSKEADLAETGPIYKIKFSDGYETDAFEDELRPIQVFTQYGLLVSHPDVLPYFTRAEFLFQKDFYEDYTMDAEMQSILSLPIQEFAQWVRDRKLPECFFAAEHANLRDSSKVNQYHVLEGAFIAIHPISGDKPEPLSLPIDESKPVLIAPLSKQPSLWAQSQTSQGYNGISDIVAELTATVKSMDVELPDNFPLGGYIGLLQGIKLDQ